MAGVESGVAYEVRLQDGKWSKYAPTGEKQYTSRYDTMSCTTFSGLNSAEEQCNFLLDTGALSDEIIALCKKRGWIDENGRFNFNDWFTANMSGTTENGNDFGSVWESIRKHGLLAQGKGYKPSDFNSIGEWLDRTKVTTQHKEDALLFLEIFDVAYEFILYGVPNPSVIEYHLKQAPIHIGTAVCGGWNFENPINQCGLEGINHATLAHGSEDKVATDIFDHYDPMEKRLAWDYPIPYAVKGVITLKKQAPPAPPKPSYVFTRPLKKGMSGEDVAMLQKALKSLGFFTLAYTTDYYGYYTEQAVKAFQARYASEVLTPWGITVPTGYFGTTTMKKLNELLK